MALRARGLAARIRAWSPSPSTRDRCREADWCDEVSGSAAEACRGADLVVACGPVDRIPGLLAEIAPACGEGCLVTDVGSTKKTICAKAREAFPPGHPARFVGSHPMAGSEKSGLAYADPGLFAGRTCLVTPDEGTDPGALARIRALWEGLGMRTSCFGPPEHDRVVAEVSHLPHALAAILCAMLSERAVESAAAAGPGLRDSTRIAAGDPELWAAIFRENEPALREALARFDERLGSFRRVLASGDDEALAAYLGGAKRFRDGLDAGCGREGAPPSTDP